MSYGSSKFLGNCWSRDKGFHNPNKLPNHIIRILQNPAKRKKGKIMNTVSFETAKKLKEAGFKADIKFYWREFPDGESIPIIREVGWDFLTEHKFPKNKLIKYISYPAPHT